ncbi:MAG: hypothetical protein CH6_1057 [Candidatus Kapaibacterium sp.]|nr:MAG: hypothetical protein CH6_1057 [Candidatus Kapabacteria bacterium]
MKLRIQIPNLKFLPRLEPTYKELKPDNRICQWIKNKRLEPTYKELKHFIWQIVAEIAVRLEPTYKELKHILPQ